MMNFLSPPTIFMRDINVSYHTRTIFNNFEFTIPAGKCVCLLGQSGIGKSTLLRLIAKLPTGADASNFNATIETSDKKPLTDRIAYMSQQDLLVPWQNVLNNVLLGYRLHGERITKQLKTAAKDLLEQVGLSHAIYQLPHTLSGGMKQRTALARTLIHHQPIVLMDEPFSSLDAISRFRLQTLAADLLKDRTVLLVTHDPLEALRLADIIYVLSGKPARLSEAIIPSSATPRDPSDQEILKLQAKLLHKLDEEFQS